MLKITITVEGLDYLKERLQGFTTQADSIIQEALVESAKVNIVTVAKSLAPYRTGALRASIDALPSDENPLGCNVVADRSYAKYLEFGTKYIPEGKYTFLSPSVEMGREQIIQDLKESMLEALSS